MDNIAYEVYEKFPPPPPNLGWGEVMNHQFVGLYMTIFSFSEVKIKLSHLLTFWVFFAAITKF